MSSATKLVAVSEVDFLEKRKYLGIGQASGVHLLKGCMLLGLQKLDS